MNKYILELEEMIESGFNPDLFEKRAYEISIQLNTCEEYIQLSNLVRWVEFDDELRAIDMAHNIIDRAIEIAVTQKNKKLLEQIADELEMGMELDERAQEVRSIIESL